MSNFMYDVASCLSEDCPRKETCLRYTYKRKPGEVYTASEFYYVCNKKNDFEMFINDGDME